MLQLRPRECWREITIESPNEWKNVEHRVYVDTPGLFDTARIKQAAQEIKASLKLAPEGSPNHISFDRRGAAFPDASAIDCIAKSN